MIIQKKGIGIFVSLLIYFPVMQFLFDVYSNAFGNLIYLRAIYTIGILLVLYYYALKKRSPYSLLWVLLFYWILLFPMSSDITRTLIEFAKVAVSLLTLPLAYKLINTEERFKILLKAPILLSIIYIITTVVANYFHVGVNFYDRGGKEGILMIGSGQLYAPAVSVTIFPLFVDYKKVSNFKKRILFVIGVITVFLLILSLRRTTILIVITGLSTYYIFNKNVKKYVLIIFSILLLAVVLFPVYENILMEQLRFRQKVFFNESYDVEREGRFQELTFIVKDMKQGGLAQVLFGKELFNSIGHYGAWKYGNRMIHVDFSRILHGSGILGLLLYLFFLFQVFKVYYKNRKKSSVSIFNSLFYSLFVLLILISFSGQMYAIAFRSMLFIFLGALTRRLTYKT
jgi:O-antigen ligase